MSGQRRYDEDAGLRDRNILLEMQQRAEGRTMRFFVTERAHCRPSTDLMAKEAGMREAGAVDHLVGGGEIATRTFSLKPWRRRVQHLHGRRAKALTEHQSVWLDSFIDHALRTDSSLMTPSRRQIVAPRRA